MPNPLRKKLKIEAKASSTREHAEISARPQKVEGSASMSTLQSASSIIILDKDEGDTVSGHSLGVYQA